METTKSIPERLKIDSARIKRPKIMSSLSRHIEKSENGEIAVLNSNKIVKEHIYKLEKLATNDDEMVEL
jgi:hypothetical protein